MEVLNEEKHPGLEAPKTPSFSDAEEGPYPLAWLEGVRPSDTREAHPRAREVLNSCRGAVPEHDHLEKKRTPHRPHRRSPKTTESSRKATGHNIRDRGRRPTR